MKASQLSRAVVFLLLSILSGIRGSSAEEVPEAERANLAEAIQSAMNGSEIKLPSTIKLILVPTTSDSTATKESEVQQQKTTFSPSKIETKESTPSIPPPPIAAVASPVPVRPASNFVIVQPNLITGGTGSIHGIIGEALNLAQVAIALFGQALVGQFTGLQTITVTNTTKLIGA